MGSLPTWIVVYVNTEPFSGDIFELYRLSLITVTRFLDFPVYIYDVCYEFNKNMWHEIVNEFNVHIVDASMLGDNVVLHTLDILLSQKNSIIYLTYYTSFLTKYSRDVSNAHIVNSLHELFCQPTIYVLLLDTRCDMDKLSEASAAIVPMAAQKIVHNYLNQHTPTSLFDMDLSPVRNWFVSYNIRCAETKCKISNLIQELRTLSCINSPKIDWEQYMKKNQTSAQGLVPSTNIYAIVSYESSDYQKVFLDDSFFYYPVLDICSELLSVGDKTNAPSDPLLWNAGNEYPNIFNTNGFYPKCIDSSQNRSTSWFRRFSYPTSGLFVKKISSNQILIPRTIHHIWHETSSEDLRVKFSINSWKTLVRSPWTYCVWTIQEILDQVFLMSTESTVWFRLYHMYQQSSTDSPIQLLILMLGLLNQFGGIAMIGEYVPRKIFEDDMLMHEFWSSFNSEEKTGTSIDLSIIASIPQASTIRKIRSHLETSLATMNSINHLILSDSAAVVYPSYYTHVALHHLPSVFSDKTVCANISTMSSS